MILAYEARERILAGTAPPGLRVGGDLNLAECTALTALPPDLTVGRSLDLRGCAALAALPPDLTVGGSLDLRGCAALAHLCVGADPRGYRFLGLRLDDGITVAAGCRWLGLVEARAHWANNPGALARVQRIADWGG